MSMYWFVLYKLVTILTVFKLRIFNLLIVWNTVALFITDGLQNKYEYSLPAKTLKKFVTDSIHPFSTVFSGLIYRIKKYEDFEFQIGAKN